MHVPLVKFMGSLPAELHFTPTEDRRLQRAAFADLLPPEICTRKTKGDPSQATYGGLESGEWWKAIREGRQLVDRGYVDNKAWTNAVDLARLGRCPSIMHFKAAATLEIWLQGHRQLDGARDGGLNRDRESFGGCAGRCGSTE